MDTGLGLAEYSVTLCIESGRSFMQRPSEVHEYQEGKSNRTWWVSHNITRSTNQGDERDT